MGSTSSKTRRSEGSVASSASSTSSFRRKGRGFLSSACLGSSSTACDSDKDDTEHDYQVSYHHDEARPTRSRQSQSESGEVKIDNYQTVRVDGPDNMPCASSHVELREWAHASGMNNDTRAEESQSQAFSVQPVNSSSRFLSRFSSAPGSVSFRLNRAASVGSSRSYHSSPTNVAASSGEDFHRRGGWPRGLSHNVNSSLNSASIRPHTSGFSADSGQNPLASTLSRSERDNQVIAAQDVVETDSERIQSDMCLLSLGERLNRRVGDHRNGGRESVDRNLRFNRTRSVGRLRDRVLRRPSFSDLTFSPLQQESRRASDENSLSSLTSPPCPLPSLLNRFYAGQSNDAETSHLRDARRRDLLEHRSNFLERRRRIRSQVRALQRFGSRFENLSGHERSCILSGQHRTGRCSCCINTRESNPSDEGGARASISRIVMLAEALFEVLDEIHQQSAVLSSRPSVSSIGSVPAPNEVVESLPVKVYSRSLKLPGDEVAQCYICLVEYEEGDDMRVLPCHHDFHKKCIDKWLKEIHRVCPLCRGDICRSDLSTVWS